MSCATQRIFKKASDFLFHLRSLPQIRVILIWADF